MAHLPFTIAYYNKCSACHRLGTGIKNYYIAKNTENNIMKKLVTLLVMALFASQAMAQINLQDSTVQVVAYWEKGDKYTYDVNHSKYVVENGDTTKLYDNFTKYTIEVTDSTGTGYKLKCIQEMAVLGMDPDNPITKIIYKHLEDVTVPVVFNTDQYGTITGIDNMEQIRQQITEGLKIVVEDCKKEIDGMTAGLTDEQKQQFSEMMNQVLNSILQAYSNENTVYKAYEEILTLFSFHGTKLDIGKRYRSETEESNPVLANTLLKVENMFSISQCDPESSWVGINMAKLYNSDQLKAGLVEAAKKMFPHKANEITAEMFGDYQLYLLTFVKVHTDTGWPGYCIGELHSIREGKHEVSTYEVEMNFE